jgi:group II intron reverse transcriptase/maturase
MSRVSRRIRDKRILRLIRRYLQAGVMEGGIISPRTEGTPQGGPLSPLLSNILLDELDQELEKRGHAFVRYADDCNIYVQSKRAGQRVLHSIERFLQTRLRLMVNREKSCVDRPWNRKFLGYSVTSHRVPRLRVAKESVSRFKDKLREVFQKGRGQSLKETIKAITPLMKGWLAYFRLAEAKSCFEELDGWIRRKLRRILWKQWKKPYTRVKRLIARGIDKARAKRSAANGRGSWWNAGASHMNQAVPTRDLTKLGLVSLIQEHRRLASIS